MLEISTSEARKRIAELLRAAERGETAVITRRGKAVAHLVPAPNDKSDKDNTSK